ncbi:MAG: sigma-70 family RNA polymerase sigma factor [Candidatus Iainarchaeum archaeon]|uniref:Sigma-70 family RNA polymerase sigma factor n=1 Tax=Candidatus Iainarchaeum sp. TaxID=3101447 RepID=A0A7T9I1A7_9ARCH|nr:MAG: sigma-70 family RNA polymerase sigma factor [Candidatus Diapherotrites archaeon]
MVSTFKGLGKYPFGRSLRFVIGRTGHSRARPKKLSPANGLKQVSEELQRRIDLAERDGKNKRFVKSWKRMHVLIEAIRQLPLPIQQRFPFDATHVLAASGLTHGIGKKELSEQLSALRYLQRHASRHGIKIVKDVNLGLITTVNRDTVQRLDTWMSRQAKPIRVADAVNELQLPRHMVYHAITVLHQMGLVKRTRLRSSGKNNAIYQFTTAHPEKKETAAQKKEKIPRAKRGSKMQLWNRRLSETERNEIDMWLKRNIGLVHHAANRFYYKHRNFLGRIGYGQEDLLGVALFAVQKAFLTFEPERGIKFSTFAFKCMQNELVHLVRRYDSEKRGKDAVSLSEVREYKGARTGTLLDRIVIEQAKPLLSADARAALREAVSASNLTDIQRLVIERRFGLDGKAASALREIGKERGVSGERIRQIESAALTRLAENPKIRKIFMDYLGNE